MKWNLVDNMSPAGSEDPSSGLRRQFYPPLASILPGDIAVRGVDNSCFIIEEGPFTKKSPSDHRIKDVSLNIKINPPSGGFIDLSILDLPDPLITLHAMARGWIRFYPKDNEMEDRIVLKMTPFLAISGIPKWYKQWFEAGCTPISLIYENIDKDYFENEFKAIIESIEDENGFYGLKIPKSSLETPEDKALFISKFFDSQDPYDKEIYPIEVEPGAFIGMAGVDPSITNPDKNSQRILKLHVRYARHTEENPSPMNPKEFFYLLFGDDSPEVSNHPFLIRMAEIGESQDDQVDLMTKAMVFRPPLRTWARVCWEASKEVGKSGWTSSDLLEFGPSSSIKSHIFNDFYTTYQNTQLAQDGNYHKCNIFVSDVCIRSGFKVPVFIGPLNYLSASLLKIAAGYMNPLGNAMTETPSPVTSRISGQGAWGRRWDKIFQKKVTTGNSLQIRSQQERIDMLNNMMKEEGRCFVVSNGTHVMIVESVHLKTSDTAHSFGIGLVDGKMELLFLYAKVYETDTTGPPSLTQNPRSINGVLVELLPGKDPDIKIGCYPDFSYSRSKLDFITIQSGLNVYLDKDYYSLENNYQ